MRILSVAALGAAMLLTACGEQDGGDSGSKQADGDLQARAEAIAQDTIIIDTHIDVPYRLRTQWQNVAEPAGGDFDYPRAAAGGLDAPFMSIYIPVEHQETGDADVVADELIDLVEGIARDNPGKFTLAHSSGDVVAAHEAGKIALPMGMENGAPIMGDLEKLEYFHDRGIRYITLAHAKTNHISDSSYDENRPLQGLSDFGKELIPAMNDIGMMIDVSHITDDAFWQVIALTDVPVIASHSSARHFTPGFERNMADDMIEAMGKNGGVVMINFGSSFLTQEANEASAQERAAYEAYAEEQGVEPTYEGRRQFIQEYRKENPFPFADVDDVLDHIDHVVDLAGIDHVGIGSDYDGVGDTLPVGLKDASSYPNLVRGLLERGYSEADVKKILSGNILRVWREVEAYAAKTAADGGEPGGAADDRETGDAE